MQSSLFFTNFDAWLKARTKEGEGDCLIWTGALTDSGIPSAQVNRKTISVRNHVYNSTSTKPLGSRIIYLCCGNQRCLNFDHMKTKSVNQARRDAMKTRTSSPSELQRMRAAAPKTKINEEQVAKLLARLSEPGVTKIQAAKEFGLTPGHVSKIYRGICWGGSSKVNSVFSWRP